MPPGLRLLKGGTGEGDDMRHFDVMVDVKIKHLRLVVILQMWSASIQSFAPTLEGQKVALAERHPISHLIRLRSIYSNKWRKRIEKQAV
jgi:hypothetical protein